MTSLKSQRRGKIVYGGMRLIEILSIEKKGRIEHKMRLENIRCFFSIVGLVVLTGAMV